MKKLFYMISAVALVASFAACNKMEQGNDPVTDEPQVEIPSPDGKVTLNVLAAAPKTKVYMKGGETLWVSEDVITVFAEDGTSAVSEPVSEAADLYNFTVPGWDAGKTPSIAVATGPASYFSYYKKLTYTERVIRAKLRPEQALYHKNTFGKLVNIAVGELACNEEGVYSTTMRNLCGLIGFKVAGDNVRKVVISDRDGKALAGEIDMVMTQEGEINVPTVKEVVNGVSSVTIHAVKSSNLNDNSGLIPAASTFYACVLPGEYNLVVEAYSAGENIDDDGDDVLLNTLTAKEPMTIARNQYRTIDVAVDTYKPAEHKTITVDFASDQPFTVTISGTAANNPSPKTFTLKGDEGYLFTINSKNNYSRISNNGRNCLRLTQNDKTNKENNRGYIILPAIEGFALSKVTVSSNNTSNKVFYIESADPFETTPTESIKIEPAAALTNEVATEYVTLNNPISGHGYYLYTKGNNAQITKLVLDYIQAN